ncbi:50S ribosomal protein L3 [Myxococcota bacterium]|nr:50S ribosomal protein L3 [Myxococcota bacterium]
MPLGLLGRKLGMTQLFVGDAVIPVTVVHAGPCVVLRHRTMANDRYSAVQVGFDDKKPSRCTKPELGQFAASAIAPKKLVREMRLAADPGDDLAVGKALDVDLFKIGDHVDVSGVSKGKGYQGVMKRHHFKGSMTKSHGTHEYQRHAGSIGMRLTPGRVWKGMRMAGQMGNEKVTTMNLEVVALDTERHLIFIRGSVPGAKGGYVSLKPTAKSNLGKGGVPKVKAAQVAKTRINPLKASKRGGG